jgi:hypothetical protein
VAGGHALAPPLRRLFELIGRDAIPLVLDTVRAFDAWADGATPGAEELPRGVGMHRTALRGVDFERFTLSYTPWMVQRVQAAHMALDVGGRTAVRSALSAGRRLKRRRPSPLPATRPARLPPRRPSP